MPWIGGHIRARHTRLPWDVNCPNEIFIHGTLSTLKGERASERRKSQYKAAKSHFDLSAAFEIIESMIPGPAYKALVDVALNSDPRPIKIAIPHPAFEKGHEERSPDKGPSNALPFAYARYLAKRLDGDVDENIEQIARIGRTELNRWGRFLYQPSFKGDVDPASHYILVDDVLTLGATFAALRSHIVGHGGTIIAVAALAHKDGVNQPFPIVQARVGEIQNVYGSGIFNEWKEALGHDVQTLTELEGLFLSDWGKREIERPGDAALQRLRTRLDQEASPSR